MTCAAARAAAGRADPSAIVAKARAYYGSEAALNSIKSLHFVGDLVTILDTSDPASKPINATVEIVFQEPFKQKITAVSDSGTEVTALDGFDAWHRVEDRSTPPRWNFTLQKLDDIRRLRANTLENLKFYRGVPIENIEDMGTATVGGVICHKLAIKHSADIVFYRYIDQVTGKLVLTETSQGGSIREEGEMPVNGIRFAKKMITTVTQPNGKTATITVTFSRITVNEMFPDSYFAVPALPAK